MEHVKRLLMINCCCLILILWVPKELIKEKTLILSKRTFYLDPRIIKLCFSNSNSWYNLKQPPKGLSKKAVLKIFGKFKLQVFRQNFLDRLFYWTLPVVAFIYWYIKKYFFVYKNKETARRFFLKLWTMSWILKIL